MGPTVLFPIHFTPNTPKARNDLNCSPACGMKLSAGQTQKCAWLCSILIYYRSSLEFIYSRRLKMIMCGILWEWRSKNLFLLEEEEEDLEGKEWVGEEREREREKSNFENSHVLTLENTTSSPRWALCEKAAPFSIFSWGASCGWISLPASHLGSSHSCSRGTTAFNVSLLWSIFLMD